MANSRRARAWSWTTGEKGRNRVRVYDRGSRGIFLDVFVRDPKTERTTRQRVSLGRVDREAAKRKAEELAGALRAHGRIRAQELTLGMLFDIYEREVTPSKGEHSRKHDHRALAMMRRFFGAHRPVASLDRRDWDGFIHDRRSGRLRPTEGSDGQPIRRRAIEQDLRLLNAVFNWGRLVRDSSGARLVPDNPFGGFAVPKEENPRRPILTHDEFEAMVKAAPGVNPTMETLLVVANATGHRINSIRMLRWSDVDFRAKTVRWRADHDKIGHEHITPLTADARRALLKERRKTATIGDAEQWIFPSPEVPGLPMSRNLVRDWWQRTEAAAEVARVPGRGWHSLRRKFATEMKATNLKDLCALGGWKDHNTILKCYQQPDPETMRVALEQRGTLRAVTRS